MSYSLVIMAAGIGSRFGGVKQLAKVGKGGEAFLDFSIKDAMAAGFCDVVMIVRSEIEDDVKAHVSGMHPDLAVSYVRQDDLGPAREKPWGTLHAVLSAEKAVSKPFAVINADDYYGATSFKMAAESLSEIKPGLCANIAFELGNTCPDHGSVTRGVCEVVDGKLTRIVETEDVHRGDNGELIAGDVEIPNSTPASMNMWCFDQSIFEGFNDRWDAFIAENADEPKAEALLPGAVDELMSEGKLVCHVSASPEQWIGITNPEDFELAKEALADR